jgi:membrane associated rhomboid family serine protease
MFFPYKDDNPRVLYPYVTFGLIYFNLLIFLCQLFLNSTETALGTKLVYIFAFIPERFNFITMFTSMFLHGGFGHFIGNMWFLYIFGDNIESILGHKKYLIFYLCSGLIATLMQYLINPSSTIPIIGASGAISGVLGAYLISFPKAKVHVLIVLFIFITTLVIPAKAVLGLWFVIQIGGGLSDLGVLSKGGVAWFAHIGGFIFGLLSVRKFQIEF